MRRCAPALAILVVVVLVLTGCRVPIPGRSGEVGTSLGQLGLNGLERSDPVREIDSGVYAGADITAVGARFTGQERVIAFGRTLAAVDPDRSFVVISVQNLCSLTAVRLWRNRDRVIVIGKQTNRECVQAEWVALAWQVDYADLPDPATVTLCRAAWTVQGKAVTSPAGEPGRC